MSVDAANEVVPVRVIAYSVYNSEHHVHVYETENPLATSLDEIRTEWATAHGKMPRDVTLLDATTILPRGDRLFFAYKRKQPLILYAIPSTAKQTFINVSPISRGRVTAGSLEWKGYLESPLDFSSLPETLKDRIVKIPLTSRSVNSTRSASAASS